MGETPNIAARLQTLATPNTVVISESTKLLISEAFDHEDLGIQEIRGVTRPLRVHRVLAAKSAANRFEAAHSGSLSPLVGRSIELSLILDRWRKAKEAEGQVVLLSGIAGVGKSRLIHELKTSIHREPHFLLNYQCSPYYGQSAFFPIIEQIKQAARLTPGDSNAEKLGKLRAYLAGSVDNSLDLAFLISKLLSIPIENSQELSQLTSQQIKNRTITKLIDMILTMAAKHPTVCIFEDVHWIDPSTLELLELAISRIDRARVLLVVSCRPEFRSAWFNRANVTTHSLTRLSRNEVTKSLPDGWRASLAALLAPGEMLLAWFEADLGDRLHYAQRLIALTDRRLLAIDAPLPADALQASSAAAPTSEPAALPPQCRQWPHDPALTLRLKELRGVGTLELFDDNGRLAAWRYTPARNAAAHRLAQRFESLGNSDGDWERGEDICPTCGLPLAVEQLECAACSKTSTVPTVSSLVKLCRFARLHAGMVLLGFVLSVTSTALGLVPTYLTKPLLDDILTPHQNGQPVDFSPVPWYLGAMAGTAVLAWLLGWGGRTCWPGSPNGLPATCGPPPSPICKGCRSSFSGASGPAI